ncbi:MAG: acyl-CoA dehydrogenase family protein [Planctomycetota bacterium]
MANLYHETPDLRRRIAAVDWARVLPGLGGEASIDVAEGVEQIGLVLDLVGQIAADEIAPHAAEVDRQGARLIDGCVVYADATQRQLRLLAEAGLMGFILPEEFGGLNLPVSAYTAAVELISAADASLMTIFALQGCGETLHRFGDRALQERHLPRLAAGEITACMALTEPGAGSALGAVRTRARLQGNRWSVSGGKIFITNGGADLLLVLARTEADEGGKGLSLVAVERNDAVRVIRLEEKLGIHGSPTAQLEIDNALGDLVGKRGDGLYGVTMALMHHVRLEVAAQAVGIAQAAQTQAVRYASEREQFNRTIDRFAPVRTMLFENARQIETARAILYATTEVVDLRRGLRRTGANPGELERCDRLLDLLTPLSKFYACEIVNEVTSRALQVPGGYGYTRDYPAERYFRDGRITNIYEGTSEIQAGAMIQHLTNGGLAVLVEERLNRATENGDGTLQGLQDAYEILAAGLEAAGAADKLSQQGWARAFVEATGELLGGLVLHNDGRSDERSATLAWTQARLAMQKAVSARTQETTSFADETYEMIVAPYRRDA